MTAATDIIAIADAVTGELNTTGSPIKPAGVTALATAVRLNLARFKLTELSTLHVTVVPGAFEAVGPNTRAASLEQYAIDVAVHQRLPAVSNTYTDPLVCLVAAIYRRFRLRRLVSLPGVLCTEAASVGGLYDVDQLRNNELFQAVLRLKYRVVQ